MIIIEKKIVTVEIDEKYQDIFNRGYELIESIHAVKRDLSHFTRDGEGIEPVNPLLKATIDLDDAMDQIGKFIKSVYNNNAETKEEIIDID